MTFLSEVKHKGSLAEFLLWVTQWKAPRHRTPIYCLWPHWNVCIENEATPLELHDTQLGTLCKWGAHSASFGSHQACWGQTWLYSITQSRDLPWRDNTEQTLWIYTAEWKTEHVVLCKSKGDRGRDAPDFCLASHNWDALPAAGGM